MTKAASVHSCPSAQPDMLEARVLGVIGGSAEAPRVSYLQGHATPDAVLVRRLSVVQQTQVFRFSARCEEQRCAHFDGNHCSLAERIVDTLEPVVDALPSCLVRASCRWHTEQGARACYRCPQVVTLMPPGDTKLNRAARPTAMGDAKERGG